MKKQARVTSQKVFNNPADKVLDTLGNANNTAGSQDISIKGHTDIFRKLTFQIRDSVYQQLKDRHYLLSKQLGDDVPDREVIVEFALVALLNKLNDGEDLGEAIAHHQKIREQDLESGTLINPSSRKKK